MLKKLILGILSIILLLISSGVFYGYYLRRIRLSDSIPEVDQSREAKVLTAFFGLDALPAQSLMLYWKGSGKDGMPVVFCQELDPNTLDNTDFEVTTKSGKKMPVEFVTLKPANEEFELRTVLLIGELGFYPEDPPEVVSIVDELKSRSGQNLSGQSVPVIPLEEGPIISYSEYFTFDEDYPYVKSGPGCDCPRETTEIVVRTVWAGGVRALDGNELGDNELSSFKVTVVDGEDTITVSPYKLADLGDNDNNIDLCLKEGGVPLLVEAAENIAIDPRGDANPGTTARIVSRW